MRSPGPALLLLGCRSVRILMGGISMILLFRIVITTVDKLHKDEVRSSQTERTDGYKRNGDNDFRIPNPYPTTFQIEFVTNITNRIKYGTVMSDRHDDPHPEHPIRGTLYYDWTRTVQRIDHGPGSYECVRFYQVDSGCTLLFRTEGMYRILPPAIPSNDHGHAAVSDVDGCCLDLPGVGPPPPDWASRTPSTWKGMVWDEYGQVFATEWWFDRFVEREEDILPLPMGGYVPSSVSTHQTSNDAAVQDPGQNYSFDTGVIDFHTHRQVAFGQYGTYDGLPLVFTFPSLAKGKQDIHFLYHTMDHNLPIDGSLFELPKGCANNPCAARAARQSSPDSVNQR